MNQNDNHDGGYERRSGKDRRSWECSYDFPYIDGHGTLVTKDRRTCIERRISYPHIQDEKRDSLA